MPAAVLVLALFSFAEDGRTSWENRCARCHGSDGAGGELGPAIVHRLNAYTDEELGDLIRSGLPGMPGFDLPAETLELLVAHVRALDPGKLPAPIRVAVTTLDGAALAGRALNRTARDLQLLSDDGRIHLLRKEKDRYHPGTGLYYVQALEKCGIFTKRPEEWQAGRSYYAGSMRVAPGDPPQKVLRAIDVETGEIAWELPQTGRAESWGGVLSTKSGLVFFGEDSGAFAAVDAAAGKPLWHFPTNQLWKASPMTYLFDGRQYVAVASGPNLLAFALPE